MLRNSSRLLAFCSALLLVMLMPTALHAGGSGLNTVVVVNQASSNSLALGNYYCSRRDVPPQNVFRINWSGGNTSWTSNQFLSVLLNPLRQMLVDRGLQPQVYYVVLSMDIPFQTYFGQTLNGTTSALFYGLKDAGGLDWLAVTNSYFASEGAFPEAAPETNPGYSFLATMITGNTLAEARQVVDQGVNADGTFPKAPVFLAKTSDPLRNGRYRSFDNAVFNSRLCRNLPLIRTNSDSVGASSKLSGYQTGLANFSLAPDAFLPGAIADSMSSYGGIIFGPNGHTTLLAFLRAGAAGSYGTVTEPSPSLEKFPDPRVFNYQARGFNLAEAYYQSLFNPHQGIIVGEPLSAPCSMKASGWISATGSIVSGSAAFKYGFSAPAVDRPVQRVDLFVDGKFASTVADHNPNAGNRLKVILNGFPVTCLVASNATIAKVATALAGEINISRNAAATRVKARVFGDRLELFSLATNQLDIPYYCALKPTTNGNIFYRADYHREPIVPSIRTITRHPWNGAVQLDWSAVRSAGTTIEASEDLAFWQPVFTNAPGEPSSFVDIDAPRFSRRFYRMRVDQPSIRPRLTIDAATKRISIQVSTNLPYQLEASTDLASWRLLATSLDGSPMQYLDPESQALGRRFYRAQLILPPDPPLRVQPWGTVDGEVLLRVDGASKPFVIYGSRDLYSWTPVYTNESAGRIDVSVEATAGTAASLNTYLDVSQPSFLESASSGYISCSVNGSIQPGTWLGLRVTKITGDQAYVFATNQVIGASVGSLCSNLITAINNAPSLAGPDGLRAEDLAPGEFGGANFNLVARTSGRTAANLCVQFLSSSGLLPKPAGTQTLTENLADLQARDHLFVGCGMLTSTGNIVVDTTSIADGEHEMSLVAYEGTHVRTQTRKTLQVQVRNTTLDASLDVEVETPATAGPWSYQAVVTVNTNAVKQIKLFSTGGLIGSVTNQPSASFHIPEELLGVGEHPIFAEVEAVSGAQFRTRTVKLRIGL